MSTQHARFLATKTVADVLNEKKNNHTLTDIHVTATVEKVFETLESNGKYLPISPPKNLPLYGYMGRNGVAWGLGHSLYILSVPVYRHFNNVKDYVAIIDAYDLLSALEERGFAVESGSAPDTEFLSMPVAILVGMTKASSKLWTCQPNLPLTQLVHRILVLEQIPVRPGDADTDHDQDDGVETAPQQDPKGRLVSQTDVIQYLLEHNHELGPILDTSAEIAAGHALQFSDEYLDTVTADQLKHTPASITINSPAWAALQKMATAHASCVAIVDSNGGLVAEMSAADLRGVNPSRIRDLNRPVLVYLKTLQGGELKRPLSCRPQFSLGQLLSGLVLNHGHRSWLLDDEDRPIGCISLSDVLSVFLD
ncbi:hypothetical protein BGZ65_003827 [Modicella reniformis]|uniref:CBS domain-containing protein n=1 Tax=Modicella reniformis TaxID=1440133 RepID=A0A9P6LZ93_9FUNG|nr:hypothetical protein BGZ65_003827 [Modicella reniformis]